MSRSAGKALLALMALVLVWATASALVRPLGRPSTAPTPVESGREAPPVDPLSRYESPYRLYRRLAQSPTAAPANAGRMGLDEASAVGDHSRHPKPASPAAWAGESNGADAEAFEPDANGVRRVAWSALAATQWGPDGKPTFSEALARVDGAAVRLVGYMTPLDDYGLVDVFLLVPYPVGCFFCQSPPPTGIVLVETGGRRVRLQYEPVEVTGKIYLNRDDPNDFLYRCDALRIGQVRE